MPNVINLNAESGANMIGDDAEPTITFTNSSTGPGIKVDRLLATSTTTISAVNVSAGILAANATVTAMNVWGASAASGAVLALKGDSMVSVTTIQFITGGVAGTNAIRIAKSNGTFGWIPVLPDAAVTAAPLP